MCWHRRNAQYRLHESERGIIQGNVCCFGENSKVVGKCQYGVRSGKSQLVHAFVPEDCRQVRWFLRVLRMKYAQFNLFGKVKDVRESDQTDVHMKSVPLISEPTFKVCCTFPVYVRLTVFIEEKGMFTVAPTNIRRPVVDTTEATKLKRNASMFRLENLWRSCRHDPTACNTHS